MKRHIAPSISLLLALPACGSGDTSDGCESRCSPKVLFQGDVGTAFLRSDSGSLYFVDGVAAYPKKLDDRALYFIDRIEGQSGAAIMQLPR